MGLFEPEIEDEYNRTLSNIDFSNDISRPNALSVQDIIKAHYLIANHFYLEGEGLGGIGPRDAGLLHSAAHRQIISFGGKQKWNSIYDICATLFFGLIMNHPFHDANKRTALLSSIYLLYKSGLCPKIEEKELEDFTVFVADNNLDRFSRFRELRKSSEDPEVEFISYFLRKSTRPIDNTSYTITYRQLESILNRNGFYMENPYKNYIDIVKYEERRPILGMFGKPKKEARRVLNIGFPRWSAEVARSTLKEIREATELSSKHGVDSASFFRGVDAMQSLIATYNEPLMRLAHR
ncbi:MAG: type II toxin-antitoxin system death-on-curing family toxin [Bosea sp.]|nr:type II toxin-antitoxin system death-on-curing family toxin [Bosea sp. (in: a-proteobacteria)]